MTKRKMMALKWLWILKWFGNARHSPLSIRFMPIEMVNSLNSCYNDSRNGIEQLRISTLQRLKITLKREKKNVIFHGLRHGVGHELSIHSREKNYTIVVFFGFTLIRTNFGKKKPFKYILLSLSSNSFFLLWRIGCFCVCNWKQNVRIVYIVEKIIEIKKHNLKESIYKSHFQWKNSCLLIWKRFPNRFVWDCIPLGQKYYNL